MVLGVAKSVAPHRRARPACSDRQLFITTSEAARLIAKRDLSRSRLSTATRRRQGSAVHCVHWRDRGSPASYQATWSANSGPVALSRGTCNLLEKTMIVDVH